MGELKTYAITDVGLVREENEDSYLVKAYRNMLLLVVADGMGGHARGKEASTTAVRTIVQYFDQYKDVIPLEELMSKSLEKANERIWTKSQQGTKKVTMGTTCTMLVLKKEKGRLYGYLSHIGDSKLFHIRENLIAQRTEDHTWVSEMIKSGVMTHEEAERSPNKSLLTKALGGRDKIEIDPPTKFEVNEGDILLLCTDGLTTHVSPDEILQTIENTKDIKSAGRQLVRLAKNRGGTDNITIVLVEHGNYERRPEIPAPLFRTSEKSKPKKSRKRYIILILAIILLVLITALFKTVKSKHIYITGIKRQQVSVVKKTHILKKTKKKSRPSSSNLKTGEKK